MATLQYKKASDTNVVSALHDYIIIENRSIPAFGDSFVSGSRYVGVLTGVKEDKAKEIISKLNDRASEYYSYDLEEI